MVHKALVIDQDPAAAEQFKGYIGPLFTSVYTECVTGEVERSCRGLKPDAIFINLTIGQRQVSFDFLEKLFPTLEPRPFIFGYLDRSEPELIAHAIENGVSDIFIRSFDTDIMASKITRFISSEQAGNHEINYTKLERPQSGLIKAGLKLINVDENGFTFSSQHFISKGARFDLTAPLSQEIFGADSVPLMISKTWLGENNSEFLCFAEPKDATTLSGSLRKFILGKL